MPQNPNKSALATFLVLDYRKPKETELCLKSIRQNAQFDHEIIYLDNGSNDEYPFDLYQDGLCDIFISKKRGMGGGYGQTDLFRFCDTKYAFFVQSDQFLNYPLTEQNIQNFIEILKSGFDCVDLNGDQSQKGIWTDRAHFIDVDFFNSLAPFSNGGPGEFHHLRWNENYLQEVFEKRGNKIAHIKPTIFIDNGVWTVRALPCGGQVSMRTDTKQVNWEKLPKEPYIFPDHTDKEWAEAIAGKWINGTIPENYKKHSFNCWGNV